MKNKIQLSLSILTIAALFFLPLMAYAGTMSPFVGHWQATDIDGSDIRLTIAGPPDGPFQITWKDSHMSFCNGEPGIIRGTGLLNESDANLLEADLHVECFTTGASMDAHLALRYHPTTNTLSARYSNGKVVIWHRPGQLPPPLPTLDLRVNYGHDWVESFYEAGHMAWITVTESDGVTVKATAELLTEPKDFWGGETGFQSGPDDWDSAQPDIQPYDWVYAWLDNGASAQVQIGDISGLMDLEADSISGTILAPWFSDQVNVECFPWGAPEPQPDMKFDTVLPNGADPYSCSWFEEWDIRPGQDVGVGYFGPDGHWVANGFQVPHTWMITFPEVDNIFGYGWLEASTVSLAIDDLATGESPDYTQEAVVGPAPWDPNDINAYFNFQGQYDLKVGDIVTLSGSGLVLEYTVQNLAITEINKEADQISGTANAGAMLTVLVYGDITLYPVTGEDEIWIADFGSEGVDLQEGTCGRAEILDEDVNSTAIDWCAPPAPFIIAHPDGDWVEGWNFMKGSTVSLNIYDPDENLIYEGSEIASPPDWEPSLTYVQFNLDFDLQAGDHLWMTDETDTKDLIVSNLVVTAVNLDERTVSGIANPGSEVVIEYYPDMLFVTADQDGYWMVTIEGMTAPSSGMATQFDVDNDLTRVSFDVLNSRMVVFPEWEWFDGLDWTDGATVTITVKGKPECEVAKESWGGFFNGNFGEDCDLVVGDTVTFTDGTTIRTHVVRNLAVTEVDKENDTITGSADEGALVYVWPHDGWFEPLQTTANAEGIWEVDLGSEGYNIREGSAGRSQISDDIGNATAVDWYVPNPHFVVFPEWEWFDGLDWPDGAVVAISVTGKPDCSTSQESSGGFFNGRFGENCDIQVDDMVTLTDGTTTRTHTVQNLGITAVDAKEDTVAGTADPGAQVYVWPHATGEQVLATADSAGSWQVDFTDMFDLVPGEGGRAEIRDEDSNATALDWSVPPPPRILVQISDDWFEGQNFTPNIDQTYEIYASDGGALLLSGTMQAGNEGTAFAWVGDQVDLVPGNYLVISDGITTKELVLEALTFDVFDLSQGLLQGTAPPPEGRLVWVGIGFADDGWSMEVFTDPQGNWVADFGDPVALDYEWVAAQVFDEDGDASEVRPSQIIEGQP